MIASRFASREREFLYSIRMVSTMKIQSVPLSQIISFTQNVFDPNLMTIYYKKFGSCVSFSLVRIFPNRLVRSMLECVLYLYLY